MAYVLYNDQPPRANTSISTRFAASHGHTKGMPGHLGSPPCACRGRGKQGRFYPVLGG